MPVIWCLMKKCVSSNNVIFMVTEKIVVASLIPLIPIFQP